MIHNTICVILHAKIVYGLCAHQNYVLFLSICAFFLTAANNVCLVMITLHDSIVSLGILVCILTVLQKTKVLHFYISKLNCISG